MNSVLPFDGFLDVLRARGYAVGLPERFALARLLERWEGTRSGEFRDALAALLGRSDEEVQGIQRLFDEVYKDHLQISPSHLPPQPNQAQAPVVQPPVGRGRSRWAWLAVGIAALIVLGFLVWGFEPTVSPPDAAPVAAPPAPRPAPEVAATELPPPPAPLPPAPPSVFNWRWVGVAFGAVFLVALAIFWILKSREARRQWMRELWSRRFSTLPGPHQFSLTVRGRTAGLARADVEDAATLLGRALATKGPARELDVPRSIRLTLRQGLFPRILFKQRRVGDALLVFQDVCQDMELWRPKVDSLLTDLARQGITLDRYYFDGDIRRVTHRPHRAPIPFDAVMRRRPDAPVLVISTATAIAAVLDQADDRWLGALRSRLRRTWLSPLVDVRLWSAELGTLPINVWPMTRLGLIQAAKDLAGIGGEPPAALKKRIASEGLVTEDGIERMKRLASLVPHPTVELLGALRLRFAPDVPDAVIGHLLTETGGQTAPVLRLDDDEVRRCLNAVRSETPRLEGAVRQVILETLRDSEPPAGSAAHLRWQAAVSLQELVLADLRGGDTTAPLAALQELSQGPTWEETRRAARLVPGAPTLTEKLDVGLGIDVGGKDVGGPPLPVDQTTGRAPWRWLWPGAREIVPATLVASFVFLGGHQLGLFPALWVPSSRLVTVLIDAWPWAHVTVKGATTDIRNQATPVLLVLAPGSYQLHFENTDLKLTMDRDVTVTSSTNVFQFAMPGFDARGAAAALFAKAPALPTPPVSAAGAPTSAATQQLTISPIPVGGTIEGVGIRCGTKGAVCSALHPEGVPVELIPTADPGYTFMEFVGDCRGLGRIQMTGPRICSGVFSVTSSLSTGTRQPPPPMTPGAPPLPAPPITAVDPGPAGAAQKPVPAPISDDVFAQQRILQTLTAYCAGIEALDPVAVQKVYPKANMASLRSQLSRDKYRSVQCTFGEPKFESLDSSSAGSARVQAELKTVYEHRSSQKPEIYELIADIRLSRADVRSPFLIDTMTFKPK